MVLHAFVYPPGSSNNLESMLAVPACHFSTPIMASISGSCRQMPDQEPRIEARNAYFESFEDDPYCQQGWDLVTSCQIQEISVDYALISQDSV